MAGEDEIKPRLDCCRRGRVERALLNIRGGRKVPPTIREGQVVQKIALLRLADVLRTRALRVEKRIPIRRDGSEINLVHVAIADGDVGAGIPYAFGGDAGGLGLDLGDKISAVLRTRGARMRRLCQQRDLPRFHPVALIFHHTRLIPRRHRRERMVDPLVDEIFQGRFEIIIFVFAARGVPTPIPNVQDRRRRKRKGVDWTCENLTIADRERWPFLAALLGS